MIAPYKPLLKQRGFVFSYFCCYTKRFIILQLAPRADKLQKKLRLLAACARACIVHPFFIMYSTRNTTNICAASCKNSRTTFYTFHYLVSRHMPCNYNTPFNRLANGHCLIIIGGCCKKNCLERVIAPLILRDRTT